MIPFFSPTKGHTYSHFCCNWIAGDLPLFLSTGGCIFNFFFSFKKKNKQITFGQPLTKIIKKKTKRTNFCNNNTEIQYNLCGINF